jgi:hypothetical protein
MPTGRRRIGHHDHHDEFTAFYIGTPSRKEQAIREPSILPHLIWISQDVTQAVTMLWEELRMLLLNMSFPLTCQFNLS